MALTPALRKSGIKRLGDKLAQKGMDVLILNSVNGIGNMPPKGSCAKCSTAEIKAAVKYMVSESQIEGNYQLW